MTVISLGCRLNIAESAAIGAMLGARSDVVVINSCAVTEAAVRETRRAVRRARRDRPDARILVTGCAAETERDMLLGMAEVDALVPNAAKLDPAAFAGLVPAPAAPVPPTAEPTAPPAPRPPAPRHARAFLPVQNGCDHRCTFCIIPYGRGPSRSEPAGAVIARARELVDAGHREIVLTGVDVTSYGDLPGDGLGLLVERLLRHVPDLPRIRLSSLDPVEIDARLIELICHEPRLMPHLHLSLQAGDDLILKRMKRRHLRADAIRLVEQVKAARPDIAIGADLIAGFPTESEAAFANSLKILDECDIVFGHIFPFSPRRGTPAARMPQVDPAIVRARAARLRAACGDRLARYLDTLVGTTQQMLVELDGLSGHAPGFARIALDRAQPPGSIVDVRITQRQGDTLQGGLA